MDAIDTLAVISELFTWIGLLGGPVLLAIGFLIRATSGTWEKTTGVIGTGGGGNVLRWFDTDGDVHQTDATSHECEGLEPGSDVTVYFRRRRPQVSRTDSPDHDGRAILATGWVLLGLGILAAIVGLALLFA
ncbi:DUF3592 domain-containing protein [Planctomonas psychrotolerans]|uniref:DUF3592 domain-containing protein n=1 Tax=Planctomonas psychrotolerans TaxID=2528712 RepID=UPI00123AEAEA|nr:DUF3592 domain-containing protein [Planctomonas psychrotolerans]